MEDWTIILCDRGHNLTGKEIIIDTFPVKDIIGGTPYENDALECDAGYFVIRKVIRDAKTKDIILLIDPEVSDFYK